MKRILSLLVLISLVGLCFAQVKPDPKNLIPHNGQRIFLSGMNLAWLNFAQDLEQFNELKFTQRVNDIAYNGGNTIRWWLFVNGASSPSFNADGKVTGIPEEHIRVVKRALDIAAERGVGLILCLWSFDMLKETSNTTLNRNTYLLTKKENTQAWIDNALIPLVKSVGNHPGLMAWEVFNEPEGMAQSFGWTRKKVSMEKIQAFVNRTAGAIHRTVPGALVTNGSWNIQVLTDENNMVNYYSDARLIAAGGDTDGTLDFYQVHYYPEHFTDDISPFHHPKSFWKLDKPVVIGEFPSKGIVRIAGKPDFRASKELSTEEAWRFAIEQGYAGALSWTLSNHDGYGGFSASQEAMNAVRDDYPSYITIDTSKIVRSPSLTKAILEPLLSLTKSDWGTILDLKDYFSDPVDGAVLQYSLVKNSAPTIANLSISPQGILTGKPGTNVSAQNFNITVRAANKGGASTETSFMIHVLDPDHGNIALFKPVKVSSTEKDEAIASYAVDGNPKTRWSSIYADAQSITIDLQGKFSLNKAKLTWEAAFGRNYDILGSTDGSNWTILASKTNGSGGVDELQIQGEWNFIKIDLKQRGTEWGFSLWEIEIIGDRK